MKTFEVMLGFDYIKLNVNANSEDEAKKEAIKMYYDGLLGSPTVEEDVDSWATEVKDWNKTKIKESN